jgi:hypothetical protein
LEDLVASICSSKLDINETEADGPADLTGRLHKPFPLYHCKRENSKLIPL